MNTIYMLSGELY